jgi:hypothetical protein
LIERLSETRAIFFDAFTPDIEAFTLRRLRRTPILWDAPFLVEAPRDKLIG